MGLAHFRAFKRPSAHFGMRLGMRRAFWRLGAHIWACGQALWPVFGQAFWHAGTHLGTFLGTRVGILVPGRAHSKIRPLET